MKRRIISLFMVLCMFVSAFPVYGFASGSNDINNAGPVDIPAPASAFDYLIDGATIQFGSSVNANTIDAVYDVSNVPDGDLRTYVRSLGAYDLGVIVDYRADSKTLYVSIESGKDIDTSKLFLNVVLRDKDDNVYTPTLKLRRLRLNGEEIEENVSIKLAPVYNESFDITGLKLYAYNDFPSNGKQYAVIPSFYMDGKLIASYYIDLSASTSEFSIPADAIEESDEFEFFVVETGGEQQIVPLNTSTTIPGEDGRYMQCGFEPLPSVIKTAVVTDDYSLWQAMYDDSVYDIFVDGEIDSSYFDQNIRKNITLANDSVITFKDLYIEDDVCVKGGKFVFKENASVSIGSRASLNCNIIEVPSDYTIAAMDSSVIIGLPDSAVVNWPISADIVGDNNPVYYFAEQFKPYVGDAKLEYSISDIWVYGQAALDKAVELFSGANVNIYLNTENDELPYNYSLNESCKLGHIYIPENVELTIGTGAVLSANDLEVYGKLSVDGSVSIDNEITVFENGLVSGNVNGSETMIEYRGCVVFSGSTVNGSIPKLPAGTVYDVEIQITDQAGFDNYMRQIGAYEDYPANVNCNVVISNNMVIDCFSITFREDVTINPGASLELSESMDSPAFLGYVYVNGTLKPGRNAYFEYDPIIGQNGLLVSVPALVYKNVYEIWDNGQPEYIIEEDSYYSEIFMAKDETFRFVLGALINGKIEQIEDITSVRIDNEIFEFNVDSNGICTITANGFGSGNLEITYNNEPIRMTINSLLPDIGAYSGTVRSEDTFIGNMFDCTSENNSFYVLISEDLMYGSNAEDIECSIDSDFENAAIVEKVADGVFKITVIDPYCYGFGYSVSIPRGQDCDCFGQFINVHNNMDRLVAYGVYTDESGNDVINEEHTIDVLYLTSGDSCRIVPHVVVGGIVQNVEINSLTAQADQSSSQFSISTSKKNGNFWHTIDVKGFGRGELSYTYNGKTYTIPVVSSLPEFGVYSAPSRSEDTFLGCTIPGYVRQFYLIVDPEWMENINNLSVDILKVETDESAIGEIFTIEPVNIDGQNMSGIFKVSVSDAAKSNSFDIRAVSEGCFEFGFTLNVMPGVEYSFAPYSQYMSNPVMNFDRTAVTATGNSTVYVNGERTYSSYINLYDILRNVKDSGNVPVVIGAGDYNTIKDNVLVLDDAINVNIIREFDASLVQDYASSKFKIVGNYGDIDSLTAYIYTVYDEDGSIITKGYVDKDKLINFAPFEGCRIEVRGLNYSIPADKKSISINLTCIANISYKDIVQCDYSDSIIEVSSFTDLESALNRGGTIILKNDITNGSSSISVNSGSPVVLDLNGFSINTSTIIQLGSGKELTVIGGESDCSNVSFNLFDKSILTIDGGIWGGINKTSDGQTTLRNMTVRKTANQNAALVVSADNVTAENCIFINDNTSSGNYGILLSGMSNAVLNNVTVSAVGGYNHAIDINECSGVKISDSYFSCEYEVVYVQKSSDVEFDNTAFNRSKKNANNSRSAVLSLGNAGNPVIVSNAVFTGEYDTVCDNRNLCFISGTYGFDPQGCYNPETHYIENNQNGTWTVRERDSRIDFSACYQKADNGVLGFGLTPMLPEMQNIGFESKNPKFSGSSVVKGNINGSFDIVYNDLAYHVVNRAIANADYAELAPFVIQGVGSGEYSFGPVYTTVDASCKLMIGGDAISPSGIRLINANTAEFVFDYDLDPAMQYYATHFTNSYYPADCRFEMKDSRTLVFNGWEDYYDTYKFVVVGVNSSIDDEGNAVIEKTPYGPSVNYRDNKVCAHTSIPVDRVDATCSAAGHTEGTICSECGAVISGCEEIPMLAHNFEENDTYLYCSYCGTTIEKEYVNYSVSGYDTWFWYTVTSYKDGTTIPAEFDPNTGELRVMEGVDTVEFSYENGFKYKLSVDIASIQNNSIDLSGYTWTRQYQVYYNQYKIDEKLNIYQYQMGYDLVDDAESYALHSEDFIPEKYINKGVYLDYDCLQPITDVRSLFGYNGRIDVYVKMIHEDVTDSQLSLIEESKKYNSGNAIYVNVGEGVDITDEIFAAAIGSRNPDSSITVCISRLMESGNDCFRLENGRVLYNNAVDAGSYLGMYLNFSKDGSEYTMYLNVCVYPDLVFKNPVLYKENGSLYVKWDIPQDTTSYNHVTVNIVGTGSSWPVKQYGADYPMCSIELSGMNSIGFGDYIIRIEQFDSNGRFIDSKDLDSTISIQNAGGLIGDDVVCFARDGYAEILNLMPSTEYSIEGTTNTYYRESVSYTSDENGCIRITPDVFRVTEYSSYNITKQQIVASDNGFVIQSASKYVSATAPMITYSLGNIQLPDGCNNLNLYWYNPMNTAQPEEPVMNMNSDGQFSLRENVTKLIIKTSYLGDKPATTKDDGIFRNYKCEIDLSTVQNNTINCSADQFEQYWTVSYNANGAGYYINSIESTSRTVEFLIPTRDGFVFDGWYKEGTVEKLTSQYTFSYNEDGLWLIARWIPEKIDEAGKVLDDATFFINDYSSISLDGMPLGYIDDGSIILLMLKDHLTSLPDGVEASILSISPGIKALVIENGFVKYVEEPTDWESGSLEIRLSYNDRTVDISKQISIWPASFQKK